ncbi:MAG: hypothetical protein K6C69_06885 [Lachnospiraceae bacterium]|nr:hypothetical protein [Lachnospiraceae bacterium]
MEISKSRKIAYWCLLLSLVLASFIRYGYDQKIKQEKIEALGLTNFNLATWDPQVMEVREFCDDLYAIEGSGENAFSWVGNHMDVDLAYQEGASKLVIRGNFIMEYFKEQGTDSVRMIILVNGKPVSWRKYTETTPTEDTIELTNIPHYEEGLHVQMLVTDQFQLSRLAISADNRKMSWQFKSMIQE